MSERRARGAETATTAEDVQPQVDAVAEQLYGLPPDEFSSARDEYVRQAREQRNQALARELGKLRKPTQSAWLLNLLWRNQREVMEQLFELASELSQAQSEAAGPALRELTAQRRQIENALLRQAVTLAEQAGVRVSDSVAREAQETLSAALAIPEVADEVRSGRLVKPASYAGFGAAGPGAGGGQRSTASGGGGQQNRAASLGREPIDLAAAQRARSAQGDRRGAEEAQKAGADDPARRAEEEAAERAREEEERRRAAQRRLDEARAAVAMAEAEVSRTSKAVAEAEQRETDRRQQLETLREQVRRVEAEVSAAAGAADDARRARANAEARLAAAEQSVAEAEQASRH